MNYDLELKGQKEFLKNTNNKIYRVYKIDSPNKQNIMCQYIKEYIENQKLNPHESHYIGIDFEFDQVSKDKKGIALMQINFENDNNIAHIYIFKPSLLTKDEELLIIKLLTNDKIFKILHGSESLDIPYIFNQLLITPENVNKFCVNFYDTKFLCEYYNVSHKITESCSIYSLLVNHMIVDMNHIKELNKIEEEMGEIQYVTIDINNMDKNLLSYALYDVIFLPQLLKKLLSYGDIYKFIIPEVICIIFKSKRLIETNLNRLIEDLNKQNNCHIDNNFSFIQIYEILLYQYFKYNDLNQVNYFKNFFTIISKLLVYSMIVDNFTSYIGKNEFRYNYNKYFAWLKNYIHVYKLLMDIKQKLLFEFE